MVLLELDVVIDVNAATPDLDVLIGLFRQGPQSWLIQCLEGGLPVTRQPPERAAVEFFKQRSNALISFGEGEEGVVTQPGEDPALHDLHAHFCLGFVLGLVGPGREDGHLIVLGQLLVAGV